MNIDTFYDEFFALCHNCWRQKYGFLVIDKNSALKDRKSEKDLMSSRYHNVVSHCQSVETNMMCASVKKSRRKSRRWASWSARNMAHWRLIESRRTWRWASILSLIIKSLRQIVHPGVRAIKRKLRYDNAASVPKRERKKEEEKEDKKDSNVRTFRDSA